MLNERERQDLARIEHTLAESDPELARLLAGSGSGGDAVVPTLLLVAGLVLMVLGSAMATVPIAVAGMAVSLAALAIAHGGPTSPDRSTRT